MSSSKWAACLLCLAGTLPLVYCDKVDDNSETLLLQTFELTNSTDPKDSGPRSKRGAAISLLHSSVDCGTQNGKMPFKKMYPTDSDDRGYRIIGGADADPGEFPWQISVQGKPFGMEYRHKCGGALISESVVITGGHCVFGEKPENLQIVAGADDIANLTGKEQIRQVKSYSTQFSLRREVPADDIAVVFLDHPFKFDSRVAPVCTPKSDFYYDGKYGIITGWGFTSEEGRRAPALQVVEVPIIPQEKCREIYRKVQRSEGILECNICAGTKFGGRDSCQGDSGGPMTCVDDDGRHFLCGVVSWGIGCGRPESPGVYTFTPCYSTWIEQQIAHFNSTIQDSDFDSKKEITTYYI